MNKKLDDVCNPDGDTLDLQVEQKFHGIQNFNFDNTLVSLSKVAEPLDLGFELPNIYIFIFNNL